jgi:hypothetical protein
MCYELWNMIRRYYNSTGGCHNFVFILIAILFHLSSCFSDLYSTFMVLLLLFYIPWRGG